MKKKKIILAALFSIFILPLALVFTACGGGQLDQKATCYTAGNYQNSVEAEVLTDAVGTQTSFETAAYRLTSEIEATTNNHKTYATINAIYKDNELAAKMTMEGMTFYTYYKGGYMYASVLGFKVKYRLDIDEVYGRIDDSGYASAYSNVKDILDILDEDEAFTVYQDGNDFKVEITNYDAINSKIGEASVAETAEVTAATLYLNFNETNVLTALQLNLEMNVQSYEGDGTFKMKVTMSEFDGNIEFPGDLNSYRTVD